MANAFSAGKDQTKRMDQLKINNIIRPSIKIMDTY